MDEIKKQIQQFQRAYKLATLETGGFVKLGRSLMKNIGVNETILLESFIGWQLTKKELWISRKYTEITKEFGWTDKTITKILKNLKKHNLIKTKKVGRTQLFHIKHENIIKKINEEIENEYYRTDSGKLRTS